MEIDRARQIMEAPEMIYVSYQNFPVWIDEVMDNNQAMIRDLNSNLQLEVPINQLVETDNLENE